jgi:DNA-binding beta-propeller fold protein YncE
MTTTDFSSGSLTIVDLETLEASTSLLNIHSDATVRTRNGFIYVINRFGQDNVTVVDSDNPQEVVIQYSVGNGTNPQDMAFLSDERAYVARLGSPRLLIVNPATGDSLGSVDLSFAADDDGIPEAAHLERVGDLLYVTCQRLAGFSPTEFSQIVVIDTKTDMPVDLDPDSTGVQGIRLAATNPFVQLRQGNRLYLSCSGAFGVSDGGIEVVDLEEDRTLGVQLSEAELGGDVGALAMRTSSIGYVVVADASFTNSLMAFNLDTDGLPTQVDGPSGGYIPALAILRGRLYAADQGSFAIPGSSGMRGFDMATNQLVAGPVSTGLPPGSIAFLVDDSVLTADFTGDGRVDFQDFLGFVKVFGSSAGDLRYDAKFDLDGNGGVDFEDFLLFAAEFGR